jgi:sugar phosphate isomerase/epimerase
MNRRQFVATATAAAAGLALTPFPARAAAAPLLDAKGQRIKLGMDNFSVRAWSYKGRDIVDYAASLRLDTLFITDLPSLGSLEPEAAAELGRYARDKGLEIQLGSWSICPTSKAFRKDWGTAEEHLALGLRLAKAVGSQVFRVILGTREDRKSPGGIEARIVDTVKILKSQRGLAMDSGVKIAVENHAGDMTATELISLIESTGRDYVGANMDSGNALWTLEEPLDSLEKLGPYAASTSLRDGVIWETEKGCKIQWTAYGDGTACDLKKYFARYAQLCPGIPVNVETIGGFALEFAYLEPAFWEVWPKKSGAEFAKFLAAAKRGKPIDQYNGNDRDRQKADLERSLRYLREEIGLGAK